MVRVRSWVGGLVLEHLDKSIEEDRDNSSEARSDPIDPCDGLVPAQVAEGSKNLQW